MRRLGWAAVLSLPLAWCAPVHPAGAAPAGAAGVAAVVAPSGGATAAHPPSAVAATLPRLGLCLSCHGADGQSPASTTPSLAGQPKVFLENTLIMIREGLRPVAVKRGLLDGVGDAEISALAEHFSRQPARPEESARNAASFARGQSLAAQGLCGTCHLPNYSGQQQMPRLAGQREAYLSHSMKGFRDNQAQGRDTMMNGVLRGLSDTDLADLAHYFAQLR